MIIKEIIPTITQNIHETIFEEDLSVLIDELVNIYFKELNKGKDDIIRKSHILDFIKNYNINSQEIYIWLLNNQKNSNSIYLLGYFHYHGIEANINKQKGFESYLKAAELENVIAQFELTYMYVYGLGIDKNYDKAFKLSKMLAEKDYLAGINLLGFCYYKGIGTNVYKQEAFELYKKAANLGNLRAQFNLALMYKDGECTEIDYFKTFELSKNSAEGEYSCGMNLLAYCYFNGIGTNINKQKAFELYQKTAYLGNKSAQYNLALMYENGCEIIGIEKNINQAIYWYKKSAKQESKIGILDIDSLSIISAYFDNKHDNEYYDIIIEVGNDPYIKIFRAHMAILNYRSPYLRRILSTNKKRNDGILAHIKLPDILPEIFQIMYIYGGRLSLKEHDTLDIVKILVASSKLGLQELIDHLQSFLIENKTNWMEQNYNLIYQTSFEHDSFLKLQNFCTELMSKEPEKIFNSIDFISILEKSLISLIQHDNLQINDVQVWEHVLKWGIAQNPELPSDPSSYSKDDFNILKNTLQHCIPFIKFYNLTPKEYLNKVYPYKKIIPKELREDLFKYFMDRDDKPNNRPEQIITKLISVDKPNNGPGQKISREISPRSVDSKIITFQHVELISKWIDKLEISVKTYKFKLILRGSRDGFSTSKFHEICDNQSHTVSIIKVKDSNEILGGYNPIIWKSECGYSTTKDSFIFSFKNKDSIENYVLSRVDCEDYAIYNNPDFGPSFGDYGLYLYGNNFYDESNCRSYTYEKPIREAYNDFSVEEYEIFQIKGKW
ncbi:hypothetical protein C1645_879610 [Glomus cerebriforme]|uniref:TLD-domain-containing protein n=1 Tax=Glomus cerebriforme TaxID=658196 RepID=A0A397SFH7_9GLOM|nr:hypothetical protein C1645_879610 [Glomus cerebriforme]